MDGFRPMDNMTKEKYIRELNYENRMKIKQEEEEKKAFQKEEEKAFQMIPKRPNPLNIKTEDVYDNMARYLQLDVPSLETASYETQKSAGNESSYSTRKTTNEQQDHSSKLKNKGEERDTFQMWRINRIAAPNIYDNEEGMAQEAGSDAAGEQAELTETSKVGLIKNNYNNREQRELCIVSKHITILPRIYERVDETGINIDDSTCVQPWLPETLEEGLIKSNSNKQEQGRLRSFPKNISIVPNIPARVVESGINIDVSICDRPDLPEMSNMEVLRSKLKSKLKLIGACFAVIIGMTVVAGMCFMVYYFTLSKPKNASENATITNDYFTPGYPQNSNENATTTCNELPVTNDVPLTTNDAVCFDFRAKCNISIAVKETEKTIARKKLMEAVRNGNITQVCDLLQRGVSVNFHDINDWIPFYVAAMFGHVNIAQILLTYKASINRPISYPDWTPLYVAARNGYVDMTQFLLTYNGSINGSDIYGWTPLHVTVYYGRYTIVTLLCNAGGKHINAQTHKFDYRFNEVRVAAGSTALHIAVIKRNINIVKILTFHKIELLLRDKNGFTALDISQKQKSIDITKELHNYENLITDKLH